MMKFIIIVVLLVISLPAY
ncbi:TPA: type I toxin-antitoxin system Ibs family toxin [Escherichia coli]|nr:type I toxin-antitoxin system Ibs family toxin [Escherichia coli]